MKKFGLSPGECEAFDQPFVGRSRDKQKHGIGHIRGSRGNKITSLSNIFAGTAYAQILARRCREGDCLDRSFAIFPTALSILDLHRGYVLTREESAVASKTNVSLPRIIV